jgi:GTP cyclohydrolase I
LTIIELPSRPEPYHGRAVSPEEWARYEHSISEILHAFGMDLDTPGTRDTPSRFLRALYDATAGYDGDPKLRTAFPSERPEGVAGTHSQIIE